ncbi:Glycosyltransferase like family 2 [Sphingobium faniae]|nr:Glycosyltransferase like family 2 [Sphingobium faniae]
MTGSPAQRDRFAFPLFALLEGLEQFPGGMPRDAAVLGAGRIEARDALTIRLDRLFDLFFESYWRRHAGLTEIALRFRVSGTARIEILRRWAEKGDEEIVAASDFADDSDIVELTVALPDGESPSYLIPQLHMSQGAQISDLAWCAATPPRRDVRLAGVICTFSREDMLARNLARFAGTDCPFHRLFVVNQGEPGIAQRMAARSGAFPAVTMIDQPNLGGAGGFTRGILESLDQPDITHVLLMDDDIEANPLLLARIATVLGYVGERDCIGGAMLDLYDPGKLFTCGDRLHPSRPAIVHIAPAEPCDVTTDAGRDFIARQHEPDFNGWWCFAFPVDAVRQCGLPLPLFIRGDDVEFGYRLSRAGFRTIGWAGIAVWHMPFALKTQPWHAFYDRRNMLFLCEAHGLFSQRRLARSAWGSVINAIVTYDYARAAATIEGIGAFNKGAQDLLRWTGEDHAALLRRTRDPSPPHPAPARIESLPTAPAATAYRHFLRDLFLPFGRAKGVLAVEARDWHPGVARRPATVVIRGQPEEPGRLRAYRWRSAVALTARALGVIAFLRWRRRLEPESILRLSNPASWRAYLERPGRLSCDKRFASAADNGMAHYRHTEATSSEPCDPPLPKP